MCLEIIRIQYNINFIKYSEAFKQSYELNVFKES